MDKMHPHPAGDASEPRVPTDLQRTLGSAPKAKALWRALTPIARRDFISWITSAKQPETRKHRIETLGSRLAAGKRRPCCYAVVPMNLYKALGTAPRAKAQWSDLTPTERRDFIDWMKEVKQSETQKHRIGKTCSMLAAGKRRP